MKLYIGNKNYSSWSLRSWLLLRQADIDFEEIRLRLDFTDGSPFRTVLAPLTPAGKVPVLLDDELAVWDTLAIAEYVAERFPEKKLWPEKDRLRARARSLCAEMHSGFTALRHHCPMNIEAMLPDEGARLIRDVDELRADLRRVVEMWSELLDRHGGPFLFGHFSVTDAYYAPVCSRIRTYDLPVPPLVATYVDHILTVPAMQSWASDACAEHDFLAVDEPYRQPA